MPNSSDPPTTPPSPPSGEGARQSSAANSTVSAWYELFSRGARDWLRHNEKVRDAVRQHLPAIVASADIVGGGAKTVRVPVKMLEHYHFRLRRP
ncbi:MAG TPA: hypothetical protein VK629_15730, partial [Steroidobacteraceae bacterium]|nr:hypothetical protein [Steroidobacteraceae bacterium]